ncbi:hypothetical protein ACHAXR_008988, partial [Thalassiosira sp. AJA248-18]
MIRANRSITISKLIPIVNSTRPERQLDGNSAHSTLAPPELLRQSSSIGSARTGSDLEYVYYFEVFIISGVSFSVGFVTAGGTVSSGSHSNNGGPGVEPEYVGLHVNGDLWIAGVCLSNWTQPFRTGDTVGCGFLVGSNANFFFTRNGEEIDSGTTNCRVSSIQTALVPCVGVPSSAGAVIIRTNFGFNHDHRFLWKGTEKVRIMCQIGMPISSIMIDGSIRSDDAFLPTNLFRAHTVSGDERGVPPTVVCADSLTASSEHGETGELSPRQHSQMRRHSELLLSSRSLDDIGADSDSEKKVLDLDDIKELARELRSATCDSDAHHGALSQLVDVCRSNLTQLNETVQHATMGMDSGHDLGELLTVNEMVTDAIEAAEKKGTEIENGESSYKAHDIFSLLCHLRGQKQKRYDAVWGLLRLTNRGTNEKMCHEILASGGMQSLLTLFKKSSDSVELMTVSALTVVYLLPSLLDSDVQPSGYINMGVIECLQFLIEVPRGSTDIDISLSEIRTASAFTMTNLWFKVLVTKLRSTEIVLATSHRKQDPFSDRPIFSTRRRSSVSVVSSQTGDDVDCSILIDAFTSLSIMAAESEAARHDEGQANDKNVYYGFALIVESICAVEFARPMAMKEGVLKLLLQWLRSGDIDLERPAANALRNLTLTQDQYVAGWVHCQLLHANALLYIVQQLESGDSRVRLAMAEVISTLTVAPHTRAGIIEARGVKYLVQLLGSVDIQDETLALAAGNALLRLASSGGTPVPFVCKTQTSSKKECIIDEIIQNGALNSLVSMARSENYSCLRFLSAKMLRVISEGCKGCGKERQLVDADAVSALGKILWNDVSFIHSSVENSVASSNTSDLINDSLSNDFLISTTAGSTKKTANEVRQVLRVVVNILHAPSSAEGDVNSTASSDAQLRACSQLIASGGVKSLLWIASMTQNTRSKLEAVIEEPRFCHDIQIDSCRALASLCPLLLLTKNVQTPGAAEWAPYVLSSLVFFLKNQTHITNGNLLGAIPDIYSDVLQGLGHLADCQPLKTRIIDQFMPHLLDLHRHEDRNVSDAATQVCLALGFNEVKSGLNDAHLLVDKFILSRSHLVQAMIRDEIRHLLRVTWMPALKLAHEDMCKSEVMEESYDIGNELGSLFRYLCQDQDTAGLRQTVQQQFGNLYDCNPEISSWRLQSSTSLGRKIMKRTVHRSRSYEDGGDFATLNQRRNASRSSPGRSTHIMESINLYAPSELIGSNDSVLAAPCDDNFLQCHQYPLNGSMVEKDWVIGHCQALKEDRSPSATFSPFLPGRNLTFDNILSNNAALSLAHILRGFYDEDGDEETVGSMAANGSFHALAIINSPHISQSFFSTLVESISGLSSSLQFLRVLDLSGNLLGDAGSANILSVALSGSTSHPIERLDLSRNDIREGSAVKRVLEECVSNDPTLEVLNMSFNDFGEGGVAYQLAVSLGDVLAKLVSMDLSGNDLSDTFLITLGSALPYSSRLVNLNISDNLFSSSSLNNFLIMVHRMSKSNVSTQLSFVHLGANVPPLTANQEMVLNEILSANRQHHVATYLKEQHEAAMPLESVSDSNAVSSISDVSGEPKTNRKMPPAETITVLFSAPLVWRDDENAYHPIEMLDFKLEKSLLWQCFKEASRNIDLSYDNATTDRLQAVMTRGCKRLHFSGHGHPHSLTFEDGSGGIHWFSVEQLKALISGGLGDGEPPFEFVFVSACHSALAGHTFVGSGVPHVVCCQQESQLMDRAALSFTRAFYLALAFGRTLKDSFEIGKHAVLSSATVPKPDEEMAKFMLLPEDGNHDVPIFNAEEVLEWPLPQKNGAINS